MKTKRGVRRRVYLEVGAAALLLAVLAGLWLWRDRAPDNEKRLQWKPGQYVTVLYGSGVSDALEESRLADPGTKNAADLAAWAEMAWDGQWGYVWGTFGAVLDEGLLAYKLEQFGDTVGQYEDVIREKWMDRRTVDCAGLIKSYGWYDPDRDDICYGFGDMPDMGTDGFFETAPEKGPIDTLPETPGLLVYAQGHIGVYVGDGWAVEAISHAGGVVKTRVADRTWTHWLKCPFIQY